MIGWIIGGLIAAIAVAALWDTFAPFVKDTVERAKEIFRSAFRYFRCFVKRVGSRIVGIVRSFVTQTTGTTGFMEETREIPESEIPEDILARVKNSNGQLVDVTDNEELKLAVGF
ncbi:MAG: hypothetical protein IJ587_06355 [Synergistaceae bacterium]|nr:hypothetical protein [Synergistaceae bacterium]